MNNNFLKHIHTVIINLPEETKRRAFMEAQCSRLGVPYTILSATNGRTFDFGDDYNDALAIAHHGASLSLAERGCAHSHRRALEDFLASDKSHGLILEDDVVIDQRLIVALNYSLRHKNSFSYVQFNYGPIGLVGMRLWWYLVQHDKEQKGLKLLITLIKGILVACIQSFWGIRDMVFTIVDSQSLQPLFRDQYLAGCYLLTREAATSLIKLNTPLTYTADRIQNVARRKGLLRQKIYIPRIVRQKRESFSSAINNEHFGEEIISR